VLVLVVVLVLGAGCAKPSDRADSPCVRMLSVDEVAQLGVAPPAMKHSQSGDICAYVAERGPMAAAYNVTWGPKLGPSNREDVAPNGMWFRNSGKVTSLAECGFEAWAVELQDARLLVFVHGEAGGTIGLPRKGYPEAALVHASKLIAPRLASLTARSK
jgi:hypothetical protein